MLLYSIPSSYYNGPLYTCHICYACIQFNIIRPFHGDLCSWRSQRPFQWKTWKFDRMPSPPCHDILFPPSRPWWSETRRDVCQGRSPARRTAAETRRVYAETKRRIERKALSTRCSLKKEDSSLARNEGTSFFFHVPSFFRGPSKPRATGMRQAELLLRMALERSKQIPKTS